MTVQVIDGRGWELSRGGAYRVVVVLTPDDRREIDRRRALKRSG